MQLIVHKYVKNWPLGVSSDSLVDGGEEGGLFPL